MNALNAPLTVWRAYYGPGPGEGSSIGIFRTEEPARAACEDHVRCEQGLAEAPITLWADADEPEEPRELAVTVPGADAPVGTGYCVVPVQVLDEYDPEADR